MIRSIDRSKLAAMFTLAAMCAPLAGCGVGYNRMLFYTKTNMGIDIDSAPPTAEITIARREGVVEPTFEGGQTPPVMAGFRSNNTGALRLFGGGVGMTFSTGLAAIALAQFYSEQQARTKAEMEAFAQSAEDELRVHDVPKARKEWYTFGEDVELYRRDEMSPVVFGTDSSIGLKVAYSGQETTATPSMMLGFRRKEFAWTPIVISAAHESGANADADGADGAATQPATTQPAETRPAKCIGAECKDPLCPSARYSIRTPSLLASLDSNYDAKAGTGTTAEANARLKYVQYFATGKAATYLALQPAVRAPVVERIVPDIGTSAQALRDKNLGLADTLASSVQTRFVPTTEQEAGGSSPDDLKAALDGIRARFVLLRDLAISTRYLEPVGTDTATKPRLVAAPKLAAESSVTACRNELAEALKAKAKVLRDSESSAKDSKLTADLEAMLALVDPKAF